MLAITSCRPGGGGAVASELLMGPQLAPPLAVWYTRVVAVSSRDGAV